MNGGPGCSSVAGFMTEVGPFQIVPGSNGSKITNRETSFNRISNLLVFDSPSGVGLSYGTGMSPNQTYVFDDHTTAELNLQFLLAFLKTFPEYAKRDLYIGGEVRK